MQRVLRACLLITLASATTAFALETRVVLKGSGLPLADATVSVLGRPGHVLTDAQGRCRLTPAPRPPFEVLVVLSGGRHSRPIRVESLSAGPLTVEVELAVEEALTVTGGSGHSIEGSPANASTILFAAEVESRQPTHPAQALENVAGASVVSEGQAAVPALRGLAAGRTLVLLDGARVTAERRVGPSATYVDPVLLEAIEVSAGRAPSRTGRTPLGASSRCAPAMPSRAPRWTCASTARSASACRSSARPSRSAGASRGGIVLAGHYRSFDDWTSPEGEVPNSGARDQGFLARLGYLLGGGRLSLGVQSDFGRDVERPRSNSSTVRFYYPSEDSHRVTLVLGQGGRRPPQPRGRERLLRALRSRHRPGPLRDH